MIEITKNLDNTDKPMTINWSDERTNDINNLIVILNDEHMMKLKLAPPKTYVKSILKVSKIVFLE